ncbi:RarD protein, DMT superfamily transporter [Arcobacter nitrofigilis DSM 7299]|uniref:RarD protein, DMT superfamily transporter n=1 Tax=Arcobacter nitrofigilis (strain ATCC 33309 / DSM 7299 / CCUG 15893 / LMG 7604 / NCTC 12251 / CI) TaxID=572480 RepID=D5V699_ARCNC|nr:EamA family transporter RarD [Arcobacter nitrofigilis]ADG94169.1 RarD protein, DMT superfamily transporter [Arcobacter nitrofigilis DSM 7299]
MSNERLGQLYAVFAFLFWGGLSPIYFKEVSSVAPIEILVYRVIFSVITLLPFLFYKKEISSFLSIIKDFKQLRNLFFSTFFVSVNWLIFIWAITNNRILEASLGYYINPLVNVLFGFLFFKERMTKYQYVAIFIATLAILYQLITLGYIPIVSLSLAVSFAMYGMIRKKINVGSIVGLFVEVLLTLPFAIAYLIYIYNEKGIAFGENSGVYVSFMLVLAGLVTVIPLLLFNGAATRMKLATLGFFQYIAPTVSFLIAVFIYHEEFNIDKLVTFCLIWIALIIYSLDSFSKRRVKS